MPELVDLYDADGGPMPHHRMLKTHKVLSDNTPHAHEHEVLSAVLQLAAEVDQLDLSGLLCMELVARRITLIEHVGETAKKANKKADWSVAPYWVNCSLLKSGVALNTLEFRKHVASELKDDALINKEVRKANEHLKDQ